MSAERKIIWLKEGESYSVLFVANYNFSNIHSFLGYRNNRGAYINIDARDLYRLQATDKFMNVLIAIW